MIPAYVIQLLIELKFISYTTFISFIYFNSIFYSIFELNRKMTDVSIEKFNKQHLKINLKKYVNLVIQVTRCTKTFGTHACV